MALDRSGALIPVDDDLSGLIGDPVDSDWVTLLLDRIDKRWSEMTITSTGTQNNLSIMSGGIEADVLRCNNASDLTITGIAAPASPAKPGKILVIYAVGAGKVFLAHQNGSSSASNRLINHATSGNTPLAAGNGMAVYVYDATVTDGRWRLVHHEQGSWITPTFADSNFSGDGTDANWALASGDVIELKYRLDGKTLTVAMSFATTSVANTPVRLQVNNGAWGGFTVFGIHYYTAFASDNAAALAAVYIEAAASISTTSFAFIRFSGAWSNATNATAVHGTTTFEVN